MLPVASDANQGKHLMYIGVPAFVFECVPQFVTLLKKRQLHMYTSALRSASYAPMRIGVYNVVHHLLQFVHTRLRAGSATTPHNTDGTRCRCRRRATAAHRAPRTCSQRRCLAAAPALPAAACCLRQRMRPVRCPLNSAAAAAPALWCVPPAAAATLEPLLHIGHVARAACLRRRAAAAAAAATAQCVGAQWQRSSRRQRRRWARLRPPIGE
jgi:hypothetical protein